MADENKSAAEAAAAAASAKADAQRNETKRQIQLARHEELINTMRIWGQVEETDPTATKSSDFEGRIITSIVGTYMVKRATELWGPIGIGWGYEILEERFDKGGPVRDRQSKEFICDSIMHTVKLQLWYMEGGEKRQVPPHFGHTPYVYETQYGPKTDMEAPKKSLTDAVKKSLSMLGFSADVFLGLFDDEGYVEAATTKASLKKADDQDAAAMQARSDLLKWIDEQIGAYQLIPNAPTLKLQHNGNMERLKRLAQAIGISPEGHGTLAKKLEAAYQDKRASLIPAEPMVCMDCGVEQKGRLHGQCVECGGTLIRPEK